MIHKILITLILTTFSLQAYEVTKKVKKEKRENRNLIETIYFINGIKVLRSQQIDYDKDGKYESFAHQFYDGSEKGFMILAKARLKKGPVVTKYYGYLEKTITDGVVFDDENKNEKIKLYYAGSEKLEYVGFSKVSDREYIPLTKEEYQKLKKLINQY